MKFFFLPRVWRTIRIDNYGGIYPKAKAILGKPFSSIVRIRIPVANRISCHFAYDLIRDDRDDRPAKLVLQEEHRSAVQLLTERRVDASPARWICLRRTGSSTQTGP